MMTKIDERKNIIVRLKSNYKGNTKGIDKKIQYLKFMSILNITMCIFCSGIILISIISEQFGFQILKWEKSSLFVILSIMFFLNFPNDVYEYLLLKHLKKINNFKDFRELEKLNSELKNLIDKLNYRKKVNIFLVSFIILILIMSLWQNAFDNNPIWIYIKIPILIFYGLVIFRFFNAYVILSKNIIKVENTMINNT